MPRLPEVQPLPRYGLPDARHPFGGRRLDPLRDPAHANGYAWVDGFRSVRTVDERLRAHLEEDQATFCLITGESGTGRTAAASYLLELHRTVAGIRSDGYLVPKSFSARDKFIWMKDEDWRRAIKEWQNSTIKELDSADGRARWGLDSTVKALRDLSKIDDEAFILDSRVAIDGLRTQLGPGRGFAACIEDIKNMSIIDQAPELFSGGPMVCVFTAAAELRKEIKKRDSIEPWFLLDLDGLAGLEAEELIGACWRLVSSDAPPPFDSGAIKEAFQRPRPLGRILLLIHKALWLRQLHTEGNGQWPTEPRLKYDARTLTETIQILDSRGDS